MTPINGQRLFYIGPDEIWMGEDRESCQIARGTTRDDDDPVELTDEIVKATISHRFHLAFDTIAECVEFELNIGSTTPTLLFSDMRRRDLEQATGRKLPRKPVDQSRIVDRLLKVIGTICTSRAVGDVIWLRNQDGSERDVTVCEEVAHIAYELGATDLQIDKAFDWKMPQPTHDYPAEGETVKSEKNPNEVPF